MCIFFKVVFFIYENICLQISALLVSLFVKRGVNVVASALVRLSVKFIVNRSFFRLLSLSTLSGGAPPVPHLTMCQSGHSETDKVEFEIEMFSDFSENRHVCFEGIVRPVIQLLLF